MIFLSGHLYLLFLSLSLPLPTVNSWRFRSHFVRQKFKSQGTVSQGFPSTLLTAIKETFRGCLVPFLSSPSQSCTRLGCIIFFDVMEPSTMNQGIDLIYSWRATEITACAILTTLYIKRSLSLICDERWLMLTWVVTCISRKTLMIRQHSIFSEGL